MFSSRQILFAGRLMCKYNVSQPWQLQILSSNRVTNIFFIYILASLFPEKQSFLLGHGVSMQNAGGGTGTSYDVLAWVAEIRNCEGRESDGKTEFPCRTRTGKAKSG